jgi:hypothetical protein
MSKQDEAMLWGSAAVSLASLLPVTFAGPSPTWRQRAGMLWVSYFAVSTVLLCVALYIHPGTGTWSIVSGLTATGVVAADVVAAMHYRAPMFWGAALLAVSAWLLPAALLWHLQGEISKTTENIQFGASVAGFISFIAIAARNSGKHA